MSIYEVVKTLVIFSVFIYLFFNYILGYRKIIVTQEFLEQKYIYHIYIKTRSREEYKICLYSDVKRGKISSVLEGEYSEIKTRNGFIVFKYEDKEIMINKECIDVINLTVKELR